MTQLHPALDAALAGNGAGATFFGTLRLELPANLLRLVDGSAEIDIPEPGGTFTYRGADALGVLAAFEEFEDGTGDSIPSMTVSMLHATYEAAGILSDPLNQGSPVIVSIAARSDASGELIGEPYRLLVGEVETPTYRFGGEQDAVDFECVGGMERLLFVDEGIRMAQSFHEQVWPGELGFSHVTGVTDYVYWGVKGKTQAPSPMSGSLAGGVFAVDY